MFDDFKDAIEALNRAARNLLEDAHQADEELAHAKSVQDLDKLNSLAHRLCKGMREIGELLDPNTSVLDRFSKKTGGIAYVAKSRDALTGLLQEHEEALRKMGVSDDAIRKLKRVLGQEKGSTNTVEADPKGILDLVRQLQALICQSADLIGKISDATDLLKGCVKGAMGVATIVVDITGVFTIPDITGVVIFKAVKSTVVGGNMVRKAIGSIRKGLEKLGIKPKRWQKPAPLKPAPPATTTPPPSQSPAPNAPLEIRKPTPEEREKFKLKRKPDADK